MIRQALFWLKNVLTGITSLLNGFIDNPLSRQKVNGMSWISTNTPPARPQRDLKTLEGHVTAGRYDVNRIRKQRVVGFKRERTLSATGVTPSQRASNLVQHHRRHKTEVAERGLPIDASSSEYGHAP